jgi:DNA-binding MarR family transcriptional regulator
LGASAIAAGAVQLRLTVRGTATAEQSIAIVQSFLDEFTAPIGGTRSPQTQSLIRTQKTLLEPENRSDQMSQAPTLTGQDVGEAEGALNGLLERILASSDTGLRRTEYITLRVLALRGRVESPTPLHDYLASQPQLDLSRADVADLLQGLEARGLISGSRTDDPGPVQLTAERAALNASLAEAVRTVTRRVYGDLDQADLETAHRVLVEVTDRANRLRHEL